MSVTTKNKRRANYYNRQVYINEWRHSELVSANVSYSEHCSSRYNLSRHLGIQPRWSHHWACIRPRRKSHWVLLSHRILYGVSVPSPEAIVRVSLTEYCPWSSHVILIISTRISHWADISASSHTEQFPSWWVLTTSSLTTPSNSTHKWRLTTVLLICCSTQLINHSLQCTSLVIRRRIIFIVNQCAIFIVNQCAIQLEPHGRHNSIKFFVAVQSYRNTYVNVMI